MQPVKVLPSTLSVKQYATPELLDLVNSHEFASNSVAPTIPRSRTFSSSEINSLYASDLFTLNLIGLRRLNSWSTIPFAALTVPKADFLSRRSGHDRSQLANMAVRAKEVLERDDLVVLADHGYYSGDEILACDNAGIISYLPKNYTSGNRPKGLYDKSDFIYDKKTDTYRCPADQVLIKRSRSLENERPIDSYYASYTVSEKCPQNPQCTTGRERRVRRWEYEEVLDNLKQE